MRLLCVRPESPLSEIRQAVVACARLCAAEGHAPSNDGNISARVGRDEVLITPAGSRKGEVLEEELVLVGLDGRLKGPADGQWPSSELPMHLEAYRQRPDVNAVIHAHPVFATTLTVAGLELPSDLLAEVIMTLGDVPTTDYARPSSEQDAVVIRDLVRTHDAIMLRQHGVLTVGKTLEDALGKLERLEHAAEIYWRARVIGEVRRIPRSEAEHLRRNRQTGRRD